MGYFFGNLQAMIRQHDSDYIYGFVYELKDKHTKVFRLDIGEESRGELMLKFKVKGRVTQWGVNGVIAAGNKLYI
jgi:hypothetical protein